MDVFVVVQRSSVHGALQREKAQNTAVTEVCMKRFIEEANRSQATILPEWVDDFITEDNPVRVIDVFVDELDLSATRI